MVDTESGTGLSTGSESDQSAVFRGETPPPARTEVGSNDWWRGGGVSGVGRLLLGVLRLLVGWYFFWAFLDKMFGFGYSTAKSSAWIHGGSPTAGFLGHVYVGPFASWFRSIAGHTWADYLFMIALCALGVSLMLGIGLRLAAIPGAALTVMMWLSIWPTAKVTTQGNPTGSTNPFFDVHLVWALLFLIFPLMNAGDWLGLGRWWRGLGLVRRVPLLR
jgi:thiosulfate dehydrogenase [quinone] large subunit